MKHIEEIDSNFAIPTSCTWENARAYTVPSPSFSLHGILPPDEEEPCFHRLPRAVAAACNEGVLELHAHGAGGRVRFCTDSRYIAVEATLGSVGKMPHFPLTGSAGFDLYEGLRRVATFQPAFTIDHELFGEVTLPASAMAEYTLHLPLYSEVKSLRILLDRDARLEAATPYGSLPVVYYGSSITQGGCASRPGTAYPAIVGRRLGLDHVNLGFSGSARSETAMADYISGLPMSAFVLDYDHNAPSAAHLRATHAPLFRAVRAAHPHIPIVCITAPTLYQGDNAERKQVIRETVETARAAGDENAYYLDMAEYLAAAGVAQEATVDDNHPNDLGFFYMANAVEEVLKKALKF